MNPKRKITFLILGFLFLFNLIAWGIVYEINRPKSLEVVFFDVGQGNSALIKSPEGHYILIDGGPDIGILEKLSQEIPFWQRKIDLVILTHPHQDHLNGLVEVLAHYDVKSILWTGVKAEGASFSQWEEAILNSEVKIARAGQRIRGRTFYLDILYPFSSFEGKVVEELNTTSIIARLSSADGSFLFTGDAYISNEKELIQMAKSCLENNEKYLAICRVMNLESDVLKIGHHGSLTSTSEEFLQKVTPSIAIISVGRDNRYGHPHSSVLAILAEYAIRILRTDVEGDIKIKR